MVPAAHSEHTSCVCVCVCVCARIFLVPDKGIIFVGGGVRWLLPRFMMHTQTRSHPQCHVHSQNAKLLNSIDHQRSAYSTEDMARAAAENATFSRRLSNYRGPEWARYREWGAACRNPLFLCCQQTYFLLDLWPSSAHGASANGHCPYLEAACAVGNLRDG